MDNYNLGRYILITIHLKNMAKKFNKQVQLVVNRSTQNLSGNIKYLTRRRRIECATRRPKLPPLQIPASASRIHLACEEMVPRRIQT